MDTVISARHDDPLIAALDTVHHTIQAYPDRQATTIAAFRATFPPANS